MHTTIKFKIYTLFNVFYMLRKFQSGRGLQNMNKKKNNSFTCTCTWMHTINTIVISNYRNNKEH